MYTKNPRNHQTSTKKSFNFTQFLEYYYNNPIAQREVFLNIRFPNGFVCTECGNTHYSWLESRRCCCCTCCGSHFHIFAGTVFQDTKLSFMQLLIGIFLFVTSQSGISGTVLASNMGVNVNTARLFLRKLRTACKTHNDTVLLGMKAELDCASLGGVDEGGKRGAGAKKQRAAVAVEYTEGKNKHGQRVDFPGKARIALIRSENGQEISKFVKEYIRPKSKIRSDGGKGIAVLKQRIKDIDGNIVKRTDGTEVKRYDYELSNPKFDKKKNPLQLVHTLISNLNALFEGIYHGISIPYMDLFVEEFNWRYNHRTYVDNHEKMKLLIKSIFITPVRTAKDFKMQYSNFTV